MQMPSGPVSQICILFKKKFFYNNFSNKLHLPLCKIGRIQFFKNCFRIDLKNARRKNATNKMIYKKLAASKNNLSSLGTILASMEKTSTSNQLLPLTAC